MLSPYCGYCGQKLKAGDTHCPKCGRQLYYVGVQEKPAAPAPSPREPQTPPKKSPWGLYILVGVVALILVSGLVLVALALMGAVELPFLGDAWGDRGTGHEDFRQGHVATAPTVDPIKASEAAARKENALAIAERYAASGDYRQAIQFLDAAWREYGDPDFYEATVEYRLRFGLYNASRIAAGKYNTVLLHTNGDVDVYGEDTYGELAADSWANVAAVGAGDHHVVGLTKYGTLLAAGETEYGQCDVYAWEDIVTMAVGDFHTVALGYNGNVYATGYNHEGQCDTYKITEAAADRRIVALAAGYVHTLALLEDGTVVACGNNLYGEGNVSGWRDIVAICAGTEFSAGLKMDGTVVATGMYTEGWDLTDWTDIIQLAAGDGYLVGVKADGSVVAVGEKAADPPGDQTYVSGLTNIAFVAAGHDHTVAVKREGLLMCIGMNKHGQGDCHGQVLE